MRTSLTGAALLGILLLCAAAEGAEPAPPPEMEAAHQVHVGAGQRDWKLDTAVFIELSPVTVAEPALGLPDDQQDQPAASPQPPPAR
jgi:hypothetical protein